MDEFTDGRWLYDVDADRRDDQKSGRNLGRQLERLVAAAQDYEDRENAEHESIEAELAIATESRDVQSQKLAEKVEGHGRGGDQSAGLADCRLNHRRDEHIPERPLLPRRRIGVEHASTRCMREPECHLEAVIFEYIGDRDTPEQRIFEPAAGDGCRYDMARADSRHHQQQTRAEVAEHCTGRKRRQVE